MHQSPTRSPRVKMVVVHQSQSSQSSCEDRGRPSIIKFSFHRNHLTFFSTQPRNHLTLPGLFLHSDIARILYFILTSSSSKAPELVWSWIEFSFNKIV